MKAAQPDQWPRRRGPKNLIKELIREGWDDKDIALETGCSRDHVRAVRVEMLKKREGTK